MDEAAFAVRAYRSARHKGPPGTKNRVKQICKTRTISPGLNHLAAGQLSRDQKRSSRCIHARRSGDSQDPRGAWFEPGGRGSQRRLERSAQFFQIESGRANPTLRSLNGIAGALDVEIEDFFRRGRTQRYSTTKRDS